MSKFGGFFARKAGTVETLPTPATHANITALPDNPLELDEELFSALGAQIGGDNESLRNLMLDATAKKLVRLLDSDQPTDLRQAVAVVLGEMGLRDAEVAEVVCAGLSDPDLSGD